MEMFKKQKEKLHLELMEDYLEYSNTEEMVKSYL